MTDQQFDKNMWRTPQYVFNWLDMRFHFLLDGCATAENCVIESRLDFPVCHFIGKGSSIAEDFLQEDLASRLRAEYFIGASIFVNPPYSNVTPFIQQAKRLRDEGFTVVMLLNNDKSTQWYQQYIHNVANEVIDIIGGRIAFVHPVTGEEINGNSKGQMVVVFDPTMEDFVQRSVSLDFIKKVGGYE
ncbi:DNA N-6-adenine-methyltransferase [[Pasteurella] aerogenes]